MSGPYGVKGWVKIQSFTEPPEKILEYSPWRVRTGGVEVTAHVLEGRGHGQSVVAALDIARDREQARSLTGGEVRVARSQLPAPAPDTYYWVDLLGMRVVTLANRDLGRLERLMETGANDVMVVRGERERLIPFIDAVVREVSFETATIRVDWDPEF